MQELRFVAVSEDGRYAVLAVPGRSARFTLPIDERLRAVALGQTSRLAQYEIEVESPLRPKEIQARIRAGETVEEIADAAGIAVERVRWFEGPVLAERAYVAEQAQAAAVRRPGDATPSSPGQALGQIVAERLSAFGVDAEDAQWDAKKRGDATWQVQLTFISGGRLHVAEWIFDPRRRHVLPADDNAVRMSLPGTEPPQPTAPPPGEATVTHLAPRLSAAAGGPAPGGMGPAVSGPGASGRPGHERQEAAGGAGPARQRVPSPPALPSAAVPVTSVPGPPGRSAAATAQADGPAGSPSGPAGSPSGPAGTPGAPGDAATGPAADSTAEPAGRAGRKGARARRSSVPSWDEIMFGSNRQRD